MARPLHGFSGRKVQWSDVKPNHDGSSLMPDRRTGHIRDTHWEGNTCYALVVDRDGVITQHEITDLILVNEKYTTSE